MDIDPGRHPLLVFGDDGTQPAHTAWRWIVNQPWPDWHIDVLTADTQGVPVEWGSAPRSVPWEPSWDRTDAVEGTAQVRFLKVATDPRAMLADGQGADLMVLGLRTHSFMQGMVTGSTTEWLLHHPPAPLLVARTPGSVRHAVVCLDGSDHALSALEDFAALPLAEATHVTVLSIVDGRAEADAAVMQGARALEGRVTEVATAIRRGQPTAEILDYLDEHLPDLVVLGTRGLTGWQRLRLGSTASAVVRGAPCASLIASTDSG